MRRVLDLDPQNENAMAYLNLSYRLKASLAATKEEAGSLVEVAQQWANKSFETKRNKAQQSHPQ